MDYKKQAEQLKGNGIELAKVLAKTIGNVDSFKDTLNPKQRAKVEEAIKDDGTMDQANQLLKDMGFKR